MAKFFYRHWEEQIAERLEQRGMELLASGKFSWVRIGLDYDSAEVGRDDDHRIIVPDPVGITFLNPEKHRRLGEQIAEIYEQYGDLEDAKNAAKGLSSEREALEEFTYDRFDYAYYGAVVTWEDEKIAVKGPYLTRDDWYEACDYRNAEDMDRCLVKAEEIEELDEFKIFDKAVKSAVFREAEQSVKYYADKVYENTASINKLCQMLGDEVLGNTINVAASFRENPSQFGPLAGKEGFWLFRDSPERLAAKAAIIPLFEAAKDHGVAFQRAFDSIEAAHEEYTNRMAERVHKPSPELETALAAPENEILQKLNPGLRDELNGILKEISRRFTETERTAMQRGEDMDIRTHEIFDPDVLQKIGTIVRQADVVSRQELSVHLEQSKNLNQDMAIGM